MQRHKGVANNKSSNILGTSWLRNKLIYHQVDRMKSHEENFVKISPYVICKTKLSVVVLLSIF